MSSNVKRLKDILQFTKQLLKRKNKRYYVYILNKITEYKLRHFPEIECFITVSCPFSSYIDM